MKGKKNPAKGTWANYLKIKYRRVVQMHLTSPLAERCLKSLCSLLHPSRAHAVCVCTLE